MVEGGSSSKGRGASRSQAWSAAAWSRRKWSPQAAMLKRMRLNT